MNTFFIFIFVSALKVSTIQFIHFSLICNQLPMYYNNNIPAIYVIAKLITEELIAFNIIFFNSQLNLISVANLITLKSII